MEQSAVEWLAKELLREHPIQTNYDVIQQALEMEKEILFNCWKASEQNMRSQFSSSQYKNVTFEEYYERQSI